MRIILTLIFLRSIATEKYFNAINITGIQKTASKGKIKVNRLQYIPIAVSYIF